MPQFNVGNSKAANHKIEKAILSHLERSSGEHLLAEVVSVPGVLDLEDDDDHDGRRDDRCGQYRQCRKHFYALQPAMPVTWIAFVCSRIWSNSNQAVIDSGRHPKQRCSLKSDTGHT